LGNPQRENLFSRFVKDEYGATTIEYGLIAAPISIAIISAATPPGNNISTTFKKVANNVG